MRTRGLSFILLLALVPVACGGGGGGGGGGAAGFRVVSVDPRTGTGNLPNDTTVSVFLSVPVRADTVSETTFYVVPEGGLTPHPGVREVASNGLRVTFRPEPRFETSTTYEVRVTVGLTSTAGDPLLSPYSSSFGTNPWDSPDRVKQDNFEETLETLARGRSRHSSTTLPPDAIFPDEYVLIAGGYTTGMTITATSELYDPARDGFLGGGAMSLARANHTATLVEGGFVLVAGGEMLDPDGVPVAHGTTEIYSRAANVFLDGPDLLFARSVHAATPLGDGRVLITGGDVYDEDGWPTASNTAEVYVPDPYPGRFERVGDMAVSRSGHRATLLADGRVLVTGGSGSLTAEVFDPATNTFTPAAGEMKYARWRHGAVLLPTGRVLLAGGGSRYGELYDPGPGTFHLTTGADSTSRYAALHLPYRAGDVLIIGGFEFVEGGGILLHSTLEQFAESYGSYGSYFQLLPNPPNGVYLRDNRAYAAWSRLGDGRFLITGGLGPTFEGPDIKRALVFDPSPD